MADSYGIQVAENSASLDTAADYQLVLDSRWKVLDVAMEVAIDQVIKVSSTEIVRTNLFEHGLSFRPLIDHNLPFFTNQFNNPVIGSDDTYIYILTEPTAVGEAAHIRAKVRVYNVNIFEEYESPKGVQFPSAGEPSPYGIRAADRYNRGDVEHGNGVGLSIDSDFRPLSIHKVGHVTAEFASDGGTGQFEIENDLPYPPLVLFISRLDADFGPAARANETRLSSQKFGRMQYINNKIIIGSFNATVAGDLWYIICKDPILVS